uniref:Uncharacterized protein n=1 Tax=Ditylenchus dipsaci TaxID=166011 RepID=A0A915DTY1_9BILA
MVQFDSAFPKDYPYGVLKTIQWVSPLAVLITIYLGSYIYPSVTFVLFISWAFFFIAFATWICYGLGMQRTVRPKTRASPNTRAYVQKFQNHLGLIVSVAGTVVFGICALICVIAMFNGLSYRTGLFLTYMFATIFCLIAGGAFGYFAILIYRACPMEI